MIAALQAGQDASSRPSRSVTCVSARVPSLGSARRPQKVSQNRCSGCGSKRGGPVILCNTRILIQLDEGLEQVFVPAPGGSQLYPAQRVVLAWHVPAGLWMVCCVRGSCPYHQDMKTSRGHGAWCRSGFLASAFESTQQGSSRYLKPSRLHQRLHLHPDVIPALQRSGARRLPSSTTSRCCTAGLAATLSLWRWLHARSRMLSFNVALLLYAHVQKAQRQCTN